jgi:hypothetical protein
VPPFSDAKPTGAGAPAMNDGTEHGVAACCSSASSGDPESAQPPVMTTAQIMDFADTIESLPAGESSSSTLGGIIDRICQ